MALARHDTLCRSLRTVEKGVGSVSGLLPFNANRLLLDGDVYQFGVFEGSSLARLVRIYDDPRTRLWGFDTFSGLPSEEPNQTTTVTWKPGTFDVGGTASVPRIAQQIGLRGRGELLAGLFSDTLTPYLAMAKGMRPAVYVDVDADLYVSSRQALDWLFMQRLAVPGTVVGYDDFWVLPCIHGDPHPLEHGEGKAHAEVAEKYGVHFRCICGPCALRNGGSWGWRTYFLVEAVGVAPVTGVTIDADAFLRESAVCHRSRRKSAAAGDRNGTTLPAYVPAAAAALRLHAR